MACSLKKHVKTMHEDGNSYIIDTCPVCSKHFKYKTALENHMKKVHHSSVPNEPQEYRLVCPEFWSLEELTLRFLFLSYSSVPTSHRLDLDLNGKGQGIASDGNFSIQRPNCDWLK